MKPNQEFTASRNRGHHHQGSVEPPAFPSQLAEVDKRISECDEAIKKAGSCNFMPMIYWTISGVGTVYDMQAAQSSIVC